VKENKRKIEREEMRMTLRGGERQWEKREKERGERGRETQKVKESKIKIEREKMRMTQRRGKGNGKKRERNRERQRQRKGSK
jgi:hypothetical protein